MRTKALAFLLLAALVVPVAGGQTDAQAAADYRYPLHVEDEEGDQQGVGGTPGTANPENDILAFEVTDDDEVLVFRITMATLDFSLPAGDVTLTVQLDGPAGEDWEATVQYEDGGEGMEAGLDFSPGGGGDDDEPVPGMYAEAAPDEDAVYMFFPHEDTGINEGDTITFSSLDSGRGAGASASGRDTVDVSGITYTLARAALSDEGDGGDVTYAELDDPELELEFDEPTDGTWVYNWTSSWEHVTINYTVEADEGELEMLLMDADNRTLLQNAFRNSTENEITQTNATSGQWNITLRLEGFQGSFRLHIEEASDEPGPSPGDSPTGSPSPGSTPRGTPSPTDDGEAEDTPGPAASAVAVLLVAAALIRRR